MPIAIADPVAGHRAKYEHLAASRSLDDAANEFVGSGNAALTGFTELETLRRFRSLKGASVIDIGCGIGRLSRYMPDEGVSEYLGIDIIPEILQHAIDAMKEHTNFRFAIVEDAKLPINDKSADIVCGFSLITHLLDEVIFEYFLETRRVLRDGGVAVFSFLDFDVPHMREMFLRHARMHRHGQGDLLRFTTRTILNHLANGAGFSATSFHDGMENVVGPSSRTKMIDDTLPPKTATLGQALCVMRA
jgi:SAM-dependent methyltransferase